MFDTSLELFNRPSNHFNDGMVNIAIHLKGKEHWIGHKWSVLQLREHCYNTLNKTTIAILLSNKFNHFKRIRLNFYTDHLEYHEA